MKYNGLSARDKINLDNIPSQVREVMERLEQNNFRAYLVGGVVRDIIQGRAPKDYDIATSATPAQVRELFEKVAPTGEKHGTVTVFVDGLGIETTTLRREGKYSDNRRPDTVEFTNSLRVDLSRRDFTVNSLAVGLNGKIFDFFGGLRDIEAGIIRTVGSPEKRFKEDALRMMRAVRFACQMGFYIEEKTLACIRANCRLIERVSAERVRDELNAILLSGLPHVGIKLLGSCGLLAYILPELAELAGAPDGSENKNIFEHTLDVLKHTPVKLNVRLASLLYDMGDRCSDRGVGLAEEILNRLKYGRKTVKSVAALVGERPDSYDFSSEKGIKKFIGNAGVENLDDLFDLQLAGDMASGRIPGDGGALRLKKKVERILKKNDPLLIKDLALNGNDLKALGIKPGRKMGDILNRLLDVVLEEPEMNEKSRLLELASRWREGRA
jgi:tRNA nucleotidyltransferase (CCA-adding enzyme)